MSAPKLTGSRCQCTACGEYFSRERVFNRHRIGEYAKPGKWKGERRCLTTEEMTARGWQKNAAGFWVMDSQHAAALRGFRASAPLTATPLPGGGARRPSSRNAAQSKRTRGGEP